MLRFHSPTLAILAALPLAMLGVPTAHAAEGTAPPVTTPSLEERLQALDQEIRILKRKQELATEEATAKSATSKDAPKFTANAKDGFSLSSGDGAYKLRIGGFTQIEGRYFAEDNKLPYSNTFTIGKMRPIIDGTVAKYFDYRFMFDLTASPTLIDVYVTANIDPTFKVTAGRFKVPFGLENLQSDTATAFITRGLPTSLVPVRDAGFQIAGDLFSSRLSYAVGLFNGPTDGGNRDPDIGDDKDGIARLYAAPFLGSGLDALEGLNLGIAGTYGLDDASRNGSSSTSTGTILASDLPAYRTPGGNQFFSYVAAASPGNTAIAYGKRVRFSPQAYYAWAGFDLLGEYVSSQQHVKLVKTATGAPFDYGHDFTNTAWQVEAGYVITGENASFKGVVPNNPVGAGWGALQVVARYGELNIDDDIFLRGYSSRTTSAKSAIDYGVGINWFLNRNVKIQLNYDQIVFEGGGGGTALKPLDRETEQVIQSRIQLVF